MTTPAKRTVLVTGASSGIGRAVAERLLEGGHRVVGLARDFSAVASLGPAFHAVVCDLADLEALEVGVKTLVREHPDVDALVLAAGRGRFGSLEELSYEEIRSLVDLNLTSQVFLARAFLPALKTRGGGDLVFLGSEAAVASGRRAALYAATKAAVETLARALREEAARAGVRVALVSPGMVRTAFYEGQPIAPGPDEANALSAEEVADVVRFILEARPGVVFDEVRMSPLKRVVVFGEKSPGEPSETD